MLNAVIHNNTSIILIKMLKFVKHVNQDISKTLMVGNALKLKFQSINIFIYYKIFNAMHAINFLTNIINFNFFLKK